MPRDETILIAYGIRQTKDAEEEDMHPRVERCTFVMKGGRTTGSA